MGAFGADTVQLLAAINHLSPGCYRLLSGEARPGEFIVCNKEGCGIRQYKEIISVLIQILKDRQDVRYKSTNQGVCKKNETNKPQ